jgi:cbb3-type cytochrome oxidase maturation protein
MDFGLYILIPLSVVLVFLIGVLFFRSLRSGQFDDLEGPGFRILVDDPDPPREQEELEARARREAESSKPGNGEPG